MKKINPNQLPKTIILFLAISFSFIFQSVKAQTYDVCPDAFSTTVKATCEFQTHSFSAPSQEYWIKFTATDDTVIIKADTNVYNAAHLHEIKVYSGICGTLTIIDSIDAEDTLQFMVEGLSIGNEYYILVKRGDSSVCDKAGCSYGVRDFGLCLRGGLLFTQFCAIWGNGTVDCCDVAQGQQNQFLDASLCISQICTNTPICVGPHEPGINTGDPNYHQLVSISAPGSSIAPPSNYLLEDINVNNNCFPLSYPVEGVYPVTFSFFDDISQTTLTYTVWIHVVDTEPDFTADLIGYRFCEWSDVCQNFTVDFVDTTTHIYVSFDTNPDLSSVIGMSNAIPNYCTSSSGLDLCPGDHEIIVIGCSPSHFNVFVPQENCGCDTLRFPFRLGPYPEFETLVQCDTLHINNTSQCTGQITSDYDWVWNMGDGNVFTGFTPPGDYVYEFAGEYVVSLTMIFSFPGCDSAITVYDTIMTGKPIEMEIEGPLNTCCDTVTYFCANCVGDVTWEFFTDSIVSYFTSGNPITFVWPPQANGIAFEVTFTDSVGCVSDSTIALEPCCTPIDPFPSNVIETGYCNDTILSSQFFAPYGGGNLIQNRYIVLQSDLIVDDDFEFKNCNIRIAPGKKIIVDDSVVFKIRETKVKALCEEMWDGIYLDDPASSIVIGGSNPSLPADDSEIWDAENGVICKNGASFLINDAKFVNNYISLQVLNYNGIHPGQISTTSIQTTNANLYFPHAGERMKYGVRIANVKGITIGLNYNQVNEFSNMDYGIYATESSVNVYGNRFQGIRRPNNVPPCPTCIDPIGTAVFLRSKLSPVTLTLGDNTTTNRNEFNQCYIGAKVYDNVNMRAQRNTLKNIEEAGLFTHFNSGKTHLIQNNTVSFTRNGFHGLNVGNCNFTINSNSFNNTNTNCGGNCIDNTAIFIENTFTSNITANIFDNIIDRKRVGVWLRNVTSPSPWPNNSIKVYGNSVNFGPLNNNVAPFYFGVRIDNCRNVFVNDNYVYKTGVNPTSAVSTKIRGIRLLNSQGCTVTKNRIDKCGAGISAFGSCSPSNLECDTLYNNFYGFTFEGPAGTASVGDQVVGNLPTGNTWTPLSGGFDLQGGISPTIAWYHPTGGYNPSTFFNFTPSLSGPNNTSLPTPFSDRCTVFFSPTPPDDRESRLGKIVRDEFLFDNNADEFKLFDKKYAHKELNDNPSLLTLGTSDDVDYQDFYITVQNNCVGIFNQVENLLLGRQFSQALQLLSGILPQNTWEYNLKRTYEIAPYFLADSLTLSASMLLELEDIALQNSLSGGPGVTAARVMLQWDLQDDVIEPRNGTIENNNKVAVKESVKIYPNPTDEKFTVTFTELIDGTMLRLVDITGKTVKAVNISKQKSVEVDISTLTTGVYFVELINDDTVIYREKLIKSK